MSLIIPNEGELLMIQKILSVDLNLHLFINDIIPAETDILSNLTECNFSGYAEIILSSGSWIYDEDSGDARAQYAQQDFALTSGGNVYGYYVTDSGNTKIEWFERFSDGPYLVPGGGTSIKIIPQIKLK